MDSVALRHSLIVSQIDRQPGDIRADIAITLLFPGLWTLRNAGAVSLQDVSHSNLMFDSLYSNKYIVINDK